MKKVVVFGGGTGLSFLVRNLKDFPLDLYCVISVSDDGASTGKLRKEFFMPAVGDIRKVLSNMSTLSKGTKDLVEYRFETTSDLNGHALGNLMLTALYNKTKSLHKAIIQMSELLDVKKKVLPLSEDYLTLMAEMEDGSTVEGEDSITKADGKINRVFYKTEAKPLKEVIDAVRDADDIIFSMGSLYTSLIPNLLPKKVIDAIDESSADILYISNVMTQPGETDGFKVSDHIRVINDYLGKKKIKAVIASNTKIPKDFIKNYRTKEQKDVVKIDKISLKRMGVELIESDLVTLEDGTIKHNSMKLSAEIFAYLMR